MLAAEPSPAAPRAAPPAPPAAGLTAAEAAARLARYGPNEVPSGHHFWAVRTLLGFLANPLVLILLAASIVSGVLGEPVNATLITLMIVLSVALDFFQVYRSEQAAAKLQALIPTMTTVWRDGRPAARRDHAEPGRGGDDRRVAARREAAGQRPDGRGGARERRARRHLGRQRRGAGAGDRHRRTHAVRRHRPRTRRQGAAYGLRAGYAPLRLSHHAHGHRAGAVRVPRQRAAAPRPAGVVPVCARARRGADP